MNNFYNDTNINLDLDYRFKFDKPHSYETVYERSSSKEVPMMSNLIIAMALKMKNSN